MQNHKSSLGNLKNAPKTDLKDCFTDVNDIEEMIISQVRGIIYLTKRAILIADLKMEMKLKDAIVSLEKIYRPHSEIRLKNGKTVKLGNRLQIQNIKYKI